MYTLFALVLTATAVVIARPPGPVVTTAVSDDDSSPVLDAPSRKFVHEFIPRYVWPRYLPYEDSGVLLQQPQLPSTDWLNKEIERLSLMENQAAAYPYNIPEEDPRRVPNSFMKRLFGSSFMRSPAQPYFDDKPDVTSWIQDSEPRSHHFSHEKPLKHRNNTKKTDFALTPRDDGYYEYIEKDITPVGNVHPEGMHEGGGQPNLVELQPPRQIRQNPNRNKNLIAANLDRLSIGLGDELFATEKPRTIRTETIEFDGSNSFYGVAVISAIGAAVVMALLGFGIGWYTLSKRAKAAADVDYPAYGVTGPTVDTSGDRKLAHSAHMYHYQHQKQQIIAMERNGMEQRNGSVSDPESEDENEEGDYTVYECPGFATTGDMEVKNPLFNEDPTPATPAKCEAVKPQPKD